MQAIKAHAFSDPPTALHLVRMAANTAKPWYLMLGYLN
jgi:hypothetical protein